MSLIEPHKELLKQPPASQKLYKICSVENFLKSLDGNYLHFNRVDSYQGEIADRHDGEQLPRDRFSNRSSRFEKNPAFSAEDYYTQCRSRTYACCFSLENSDHNWQKFGNGGEDSVCLVFEFEKLRNSLNSIIENAHLQFEGKTYRNFLSINYGVVGYVNWKTDHRNNGKLLNPILYTFLKSKNTFEKEREFRISLNAIGVGKIVLPNQQQFDFPKSIQLEFDMKEAFTREIIDEVLTTKSLRPSLGKSLKEKLQAKGAQIMGTNKL